MNTHIYRLRNSKTIAATIIIAVAIAIVSQAAAFGATYYVSVTNPVGSNSNLGTSSLAPWRTITYAATKAKSGDHVYIKGGNYGHEHVVVSNTGSSSAPIIFEGYSGTPVLNGSDWTGNGIYVYGKTYITLKGLKVKNYRYGIFVDGSSHYATIDGVVADSCCNTDYVNYGWDGTGITLQNSNYGTIKNCSATDNGGYNIYVGHSNYCTIQNCTAKCIQTVSNQYITDYYMVLAFCSNCLVRDCYVEDVNGSYKGNHGIIFKDTQGQTGTHSANNRIINCTVKKFEECISFAHGAHNNTVDSCTTNNTGKNSTFNFCLQNRDGAYNNTFSNCTAIAKSGGASVYDGTEGTNPQTQNNTLFSNCTFSASTTTTIGIFLRNATNTTFKNCTFTTIPYLFRFSRSSSGSDANSGTVMDNCILSNTSKNYDTRTLAIPWGFSGSEAGYSDMGNVTWINNSGTSYHEDFSDGVANGYTAATGTWAVSSGVYKQSVTTSNSNAYVAVAQSGKLTYQWKVTYDNATSAGLHFYCSDGAGINRGNSYLVFQTSNELQIYKASGTSLPKQNYAPCTMAAGESHTYKVVYDPSTGLITAYRDGSSIVSWTDPSPLTSGSSISLRTNGTVASFDDISVASGSKGGEYVMSAKKPVASEAFLLHQASPNPVKGRTTIRYQLARDCDVSLKVYNISGQFVAALASGRQSAGSHAVCWDVRDLSKRNIPAGLYLYRLEAGGVQATGKLVVLR